MRLSSEAYRELLTGLLAEGQTVLTRVRGISMTPAVPDGATARIEPPGGQPARVGEVVMTTTPRGLLCHRVLGVSPEGRIATWGDVCRAPDEPVSSEDVIGRVVAVEVDGTWQALPPKPAWWLPGRWLKYRLRRLLGLVGSGEAPTCTAAPEREGDDTS